jgi:secondary thiamine-phosphate synthase enzyme
MTPNDAALRECYNSRVDAEKYMQTLSVKTARRTQLVDVTAQVQKVVASSGVSSGICYLYVPHTTAAITINECAGPRCRARR